MKHLQPLTPAVLYARASSDRQDVDLSVAAQLRALRDYSKPTLGVAAVVAHRASGGRRRWCSWPIGTAYRRTP